MIPAKQSPRICEDNSIRWYYGDTFNLTLNFVLTDAEGNPIVPSPTDKIEISFKNYQNSVVAEFSQLGSSSITMNFNKEVSIRFIEGVYTINAKYNGTFVTTLLKNNKVVVE